MLRYNTNYEISYYAHNEYMESEHILFENITSDFRIFQLHTLKPLIAMVIILSIHHNENSISSFGSFENIQSTPLNQK